MSSYRRNVILGATILFALAVLGWMILKFGGNLASVLGPDTMRIAMITERADGVSDGSAITYRGLEVGHVGKVELDKNKRQIHIAATINRNPELPANVVGAIKTASLLGSGSAIALETNGPPSDETLKEDAVIEARFIGLSDVLPAQFSDLATELTETVREIHKSNLIGDLDAQVQNAGKVMDSIRQVVGDPKLQSDLKTAIANMRDVTDNAKNLSVKLDKFADDLQKTNSHANDTIAKAGDNIESLSRQLGDRLTQIAKLLEQFQSITSKIDKGQGSAGALVNDPKLYESLVDTSKELNATVKDFKRLVEQWEQEGVTLKLK